MHRVLFFSVPFLIAIFLYLGLSAVDQVELQPPVATSQRGPDFEAFSEGLNTVLYNSQGEIDYTLQATRQVHFTDSRSEFEDPWLRLYHPERGNWNIVADSGTISSASSGGEVIDLIELNGNVEAFRLDSEGSRLQLNTDTMTVNPEAETLSTDSPVTVASEVITQSAIGMRADITQDEIVFIRDVQGRYEIPSN